jgi:hypothetical protein
VEFSALGKMPANKGERIITERPLIINLTGANTQRNKKRTSGKSHSPSRVKCPRAGIRRRGRSEGSSPRAHAAAAVRCM